LAATRETGESVCAARHIAVARIGTASLGENDVGFARESAEHRE